MGRRRIFILIGLVVVAVVLLAGALLLRGGGGVEEPIVGTPTPTPVPRVSIVIARNNLDRGMEVGEGLIELTPWPEDQLPPDYFTELEDVYGKTVRTPIPQGMPVLPNAVRDLPNLEEGGSDMALVIPPGKRAMAIPLDLLGSVAWYIQPGDHVDILGSWTVVDLDEEFQSPLPNRWVILQCPEGATCEGVMGRMELLPSGEAVMVYPDGSSQNGYFAQMTIQDAIVLEIGPYIPPEPTPEVEFIEEETEQEDVEAEPTPEPTAPASDVVILLVDVQDALVLKALFEMQASVDLVLRGVNDRNLANTTAVTLDYIVTRYAIEQPPKLPYGVSAPLASPLEEAYMEKAIQEAGQTEQAE